MEKIDGRVMRVANGNVDKLIQPHPLYTSLDKKTAQRQFVYRKLFRTHLELTPSA